MTLLPASLVCLAMCVTSQAAASAADAVVSLEIPRLVVPVLLQLHALPQSVSDLDESVLTQALQTDYDRNVQRGGRGRILLAAGVPMLVIGLPMTVWAATANCSEPTKKLRGSVIAGSVMAGAGLALTSAAIAQLVRAGKKARSDRTHNRFRRWAISVGFASGVLSSAVFLTSFIRDGVANCYSS